MNEADAGAETVEEIPLGHLSALDKFHDDVAPETQDALEDQHCCFEPPREQQRGRVGKGSHICETEIMDHDHSDADDAKAEARRAVWIPESRAKTFLHAFHHHPGILNVSKISRIFLSEVVNEPPVVPNLDHIPLVHCVQAAITMLLQDALIHARGTQTQHFKKPENRHG